MATENPVDQLIFKLKGVNQELEKISDYTTTILDTLNNAQQKFNQQRQQYDERIAQLNADIDACNDAVDRAIREGTE